MEFEFTATIWHWRGPAPYHFVTVPAEQSADIKMLRAQVSYGWGMIPAQVHIGNTSWRTSLYAKDGCYVVPLKDVVRRAEALQEGDTVNVRLSVG